MRARRRLRTVAVALVTLGALLQGCVGIAVQLPMAERLDPVVVAAELRAVRGTHGAASAALPRPRAFLEDVDTTVRGRRTTYAYTQWPSVCRPLVIGLGPFWPGCATTETYVVEGGRLVAASRAGYATYGFFCSPILLAGMFDGVWPCWWEWG